MFGAQIHNYQGLRDRTLTVRQQPRGNTQDKSHIDYECRDQLPSLTEATGALSYPSPMEEQHDLTEMQWLHCVKLIKSSSPR